MGVDGEGGPGKQRPRPRARDRAGSDEGVGWSVAPPLVSDDSDVVEEVVGAAVCTAPGRAATW